MAMKKVRKSFKGIFKGGSSKERKAPKIDEQAVKKQPEAASPSPPSPPRPPPAPAPESNGEAAVEDVLDAASVPSVDSKQMLGTSPSHESVDEVSFLNESRSSSSIQIVLVLLDPTSRRFELLQLEFDSAKAIVADVLAQVQTNVTEATLREKTYTGICTHEGVEMIKSLSLSQFCGDSDVVLAIPEGTSAKECARLAQPILGDPKVMTMLQENGIDCSELNIGAERSSKQSSILFMLLKVVFVAVLAVAANYAHEFISAPLAPGDVLRPGQWRINCGLLSFLPSKETWSRLHLPESTTTPLSCERAILKMDDKGLLTLSGSLGWKMTGSVCDLDHPSCEHGLRINGNGRLIIGGKQVSVAKASSRDAMLTPWPFVAKPGVSLSKASK